MELGRLWLRIRIFSSTKVTYLIMLYPLFLFMWSWCTLLCSYNDYINIFSNNFNIHIFNKANVKCVSHIITFRNIRASSNSNNRLWGEGKSKFLPVSIVQLLEEKERNYCRSFHFAVRPFPSSCLSPLQSESKCEVFVMVISSTLHMNEN